MADDGTVKTKPLLELQIINNGIIYSWLKTKVVAATSGDGFLIIFYYVLNIFAYFSRLDTYISFFSCEPGLASCPFDSLPSSVPKENLAE